jgi:hypothetical protein
LDQTLPAGVVCPFCGQGLNLYPDIQGGAWFNCDGCRQSGDMIELAAKVWNLDITTTIRKLSGRGVSLPPEMLLTENIDRYDINILQSRNRMKEYIETTSRRPFQDNEVYVRLHDQFGMTSRADPDRWRNQMGKFIGWSERVEGEGAFRPGSIGMGKRGARGHDRVFLGRYWKEVLAIYFKCLPGRLSGIMFTGREGNYPKDWVFRWSVNHTHEAGLGFYESILNQTQQFGNTAFVTLDPILALRLHSKWFKDNSTPLPLVLAFDGPRAWSEFVWKYTPNRDWVFWGPTLTPELFAQASQVNGRVYIGNVEPKDLTHHTVLLHRISDKAKRWDKVLETEIYRLDDQELERIIRSLRITDHQRTDFIRTRKSLPIRKRISTVLDLDYPNRAVKLVGIGKLKTVIELPSGWYVDGELISEARIRVETAYVRNGEYKHKVRVKFRDRIIGIMMTHEEALYRMDEKIELILVRYRIGVPIIAKEWVPRLYEIAKLFSRPKVFNEKKTLDDLEANRTPKKDQRKRGPKSLLPDPMEMNQSGQSNPLPADLPSTDPEVPKS